MPTSLSECLVSVSVFACVACTTPAPRDDDYSSSEQSSCNEAALTGTFQVPPVTYTADDGLCMKLAQQFTKVSDDATVSFRMIDDDSYECTYDGHPEKAPTTYTLDRGSCTLRRSSAQAIDANDLAGKRVKLMLKSVTTLARSGETWTADRSFDVSSETSGASGVPCHVSTRSAIQKVR
jgi:hypothetical protein